MMRGLVQEGGRGHEAAELIANVLSVWNLKSESEAVGWLQNSGVNPALKADLLKAAQP